MNRSDSSTSAITPNVIAINSNAFFYHGYGIREYDIGKTITLQPIYANAVVSKIHVNFHQWNTKNSREYPRTSEDLRITYNNISKCVRRNQISSIPNPTYVFDYYNYTVINISGQAQIVHFDNIDVVSNWEEWEIQYGTKSNRMLNDGWDNIIAPYDRKLFRGKTNDWKTCASLCDKEFNGFTWIEQSTGKPWQPSGDPEKIHFESSESLLPIANDCLCLPRDYHRRGGFDAGFSVVTGIKQLTGQMPVMPTDQGNAYCNKNVICDNLKINEITTNLNVGAQDIPDIPEPNSCLIDT